MMTAAMRNWLRRRISTGFKNIFLEICKKYSQPYSQGVIILTLGIKVGKRMMIYEHREIGFGFM